MRTPFAFDSTWLLRHAVIPSAVAGSLFAFLTVPLQSARVPILLTAIAGGLVAIRAVPALRREGLSNASAAFLIASLIPAATLFLSAGRTGAVVAVGQTLLGWVLALWLFAATQDAREAHDSSDVAPVGADAWRPPRFALPALLLFAFVLFTLSTVHLSGRWAIGSDEILYILQSEWITAPGFGWTLPDDLRPHFMMRKLGVSPTGVLYGQYPPGWPAVLALFKAIGLGWWSVIVLGTLGVYATVRLGTLLYSPAAGYLAALLVALNPLFLFNHSRLMAHACTITGGLWTILWLLESESRQGLPRWWRWIAAGFGIAMVAAARPVDGVALSVSFGLWMIIRGRLSVRELATCLGIALVGAAPVIAGFLHYNAATNGEATRLGYQAIHGQGNALGFGMRGVTGLDDALNRIEIFSEFTPARAGRMLLERIASTNLILLPYALVAPLLLLARWAGHRVRWPVLLAFMVLPTFQFFYWSPSLRFMLALLPLALIWVAAGILAIGRRRALLGQGLVAAALTGSVMLVIPGRWEPLPLLEPYAKSIYTHREPYTRMFDTLDSLRQQHGKLLVIVKERAPYLDILLDRPYQFNKDGLGGDILAVRDLGPRNAGVIAKFPDRTVVELLDKGAYVPKEIRVIGRP